MAISDIEISDDAVRAATGRGWDGWRAWFAARGGRDRSHRALVALLRDEGAVESSWWRQAVANGYERLIGRRATGETADGTFQIGVRRTVAMDAGAAWARVTAPGVASAWLGAPGALAWKEGETFELADGTRGEVRILRPGRRIRLGWHPPGWPHPSTIQLRVEPSGDRAVVAFHQERLPEASHREERRRVFRAVLDAL